MMQVIIYENLQSNTLTQQKIPSTLNEDKNHVTPCEAQLRTYRKRLQYKDNVTKRF